MLIGRWEVVFLFVCYLVVGVGCGESYRGGCLVVVGFSFDSVFGLKGV